MLGESLSSVGESILLSLSQTSLECCLIALRLGILLMERFFDLDRPLRVLQLTMIGFIFTAAVILLNFGNLVMDFCDTLFEDYHFIHEIVDINIPPA